MLDLLGNANGRYDVGDFLACCERTGRLPGAAQMSRILELKGESGRRQ